MQKKRYQNSEYKRLRVFWFVALGAEVLCILLGYRPFVSLMAVKARHAFLHVKPMLTDLGLVSMALSETIFGLELYLPVRFMTFKTLER